MSLCWVSLCVVPRRFGLTTAAIMCTLAATAPAQNLDWDPELTTIGVQLEPASPAPGQAYWRLIQAWYEDETESGGTHHIYIRCLNEAGQPLQGVKIWLEWPDGAASDFTKGPGIDDYWGNLAMAGGNWCPPTPPGPYAAHVDGVSDRVAGMGLPCNRHVNYRLIYKRTVAEPPEPGTFAGHVRDADGQAVGVAAVTASPGSHATASAGDGSYTIPDLDAGTYTLTASKTGYQNHTTSNRSLAAGQTVTVDFILGFLDSDTDQMPDHFELGYPGILDRFDPDDAAEDYDGDGSPNREEWRAGTRLNDESSCLRILQIAPGAGLLGIQWTSVGGKTYVVETANSASGPWTPSGTPASETREGEYTLQRVVTTGEGAMVFVHVRVE